MGGWQMKHQFGSRVGGLADRVPIRKDRKHLGLLDFGVGPCYFEIDIFR